MNIYTYIKNDHQKVSELFEQFSKEESHPKKIEIVNLVIEELMLHAKSEQETFYKAIENKEEEMVEHAVEEHQEIEEKINEIANYKNKATTPWDKKVYELKDIVDHHVKEEETEIFAKAKKIIPKDKEESLAEEMDDFKKRIIETMQAKQA